MHCDVAIIGGGPAGSTAGTLLRKYSPDLNVVILEREQFPRDHVGESQLPPISHYLHEMGCWDKVEAADFPIKVGATYRWGRTPELWDFDFLPLERFCEEPRPAKFEGQRKSTAFQVDRAIYDKILLDHAQEMGCEVRQPIRVAQVMHEEDRVIGLVLSNGETLTARYYVDASGNSAILRRALDVPTEYPTTLQNIAIWDYWQNADWAVKIGVGGTRIQIYSLPYGWIWFIPLGPTRTSVGLVVPASYYKKSGKRPEELYAKALEDEKIVAELMRNATSEGNLQTTRDWSFLASRHYGENWFLIGESAGFADPILSAGMSLAQASGRELAYTIGALDRGEFEARWLKEQFQARQEGRIRNHMRFADYWYTANAQFEDLQEFTAELARDSGLDLSPANAWAWLAQGGFINEDVSTGAGGYSLAEIRSLGQFLADVEIDKSLKEKNTFVLNLSGAEWKDRAQYDNGRIKREQAYVRGERILPISGPFGFVVDILQRESKVEGIIAAIVQAMEPHRSNPDFRTRYISEVLQAFEGMISDGWITATYDPSRPLSDLSYQSNAIHWH